MSSVHGWLDRINQAQLLTQVAEASQHWGSCVFCQQTTRNVGVYLPHPDRQALIGAPQGKYRLFLYRFCSSCQSAKSEAELDAFELTLEQEAQP